MEKERLQEFMTRVTQANRSELVVIMYDMIASDIYSARQEIDAGEIMKYKKECRHMQRILNELMATLDYHYVISYDLLSLYSYCNKQVVKALMQNDVDALEIVAQTIEKLRTAYAEIGKMDPSGPQMQNTQQIYAGLTYGKGSLNEAYIGPNDSKRGFTI